MNREELKQLLPHRDNMLLLDDAVREGDTAVAHYHVRGDEFFLKGHFPDHPIVPGIILCEIMAQSACVLADASKEQYLPVYSGLDHVRFRHPVVPGDTLTVHSRINRRKGQFLFAEGEVSVGDTVCMTGQFVLALVKKDELGV
jgi:3-hydroxyacyl-[acyl-carrier-protein] dehydratase